MSELNPCPKCGSEDLSKWIRATIKGIPFNSAPKTKKYYVKCNNCGARGFEAYLEKNAVKAWNEGRLE